MNFLKKMLSFHWTDLLGILLGIILVQNESDMDSLLNIVMSYPLYLFVFLACLLVYIWVWILVYHGARMYFGNMVLSIIGHSLRILLAALSVIGICMLVAIS